MKKSVDLMYAMAKRARELADEPMSALRRVYAKDESYEGSPRDGRGQIVENVLIAEYEDDAKSLDARAEE